MTRAPWRLLPAAARANERASERATERTLALERTLVSRMFTEPAPLVHFMREQSPPPPDAARRSADVGTGAAPRPRLPGTAGLAAQDPLLPSPPDGDVSRTGGTPANPPLGLYLTGLEVRLKSEDLEKRILFCFFSKGICFRAYVIQPEFYLLFIPPLLFSFFDCQPRFLDGRWTVFRDRVLVYAQGILKPTRLLIFTGFQSFDD